MANKTELLLYLLERAQELCRADGKKSVSSNYFMAALLSLLAKDTLPETLSDGVLPELGALRTALAPFGIDAESAAQALLSAVRDPAYGGAVMDGLLFGKFAHAAEAKAKKEGKEKIDTGIYLALVLAEPTEPIKALMTECKGASEASSSDKTVTGEELVSAKGGEKTDGDAADTLASPTASKQKKSARKEGMERLDASVAAARKLQKTLLDSVFGQDVAVAAFVSGYFQSELMTHTHKGQSKPATFLFAGPPGVGKTFLAESAAAALGLPYKRFDMSEYSGHDAATMFCGSDKVYKDSKAGTVTDFVAKNPRCILLFDEVEKAHINIIHLFLQLLDAGRLRDSYTDKEVSFGQAVVIFTTNAGRGLYEDPSVGNLSSLPKKTVLKALASDIDPRTGAPLFPAAICSRFAAGNVVMFNHLGADILFSIAKHELEGNTKGLAASTGIRLSISDAVPTALMLAEGGKADARTVKGRTGAFFHEELYELFRLLSADKTASKKLKTVAIDVSLEGAPADIARMFESDKPTEILVFAEEALAEGVKSALPSVICHTAKTVAAAREMLFANDIALVLCDIRTGERSSSRVLNAEDTVSEGHDFLSYVLAKHAIPTYLLEKRADDFSTEEKLSFAKVGVRGTLTAPPENEGFAEQTKALCHTAYQQGNMLRLARENKVLSYKTSQWISEDRRTAQIHLFDFHLGISRDTADEGNILADGTKPSVRFGDVIGAADAKEELSYFIDYLKNPAAYLRRGVHAPKGILLYGPPGTGKTMLARALAGESDVTFLAAEGNQFLKKYVGEGAQAVHDLFKTARKYAPSILFVDEIDAIGRSRENAAADHTADVLTAFLTEMDGFNADTSKPVFVLAATNYDLEQGTGRSLDAALLRRFDRRIYVDLPNKAERKQFLTQQTGKYPTVELGEEQIDNIAMRSTGMSLAELSSVFEMALRSSLRTGGTVSDEAFEEAFETFRDGDKVSWSRDELLRTARHEAGHAFLCWQSGETPSYLTIVARGNHGGYMQHADKEGKGTYTKAELLALIRTALAGRASETVYYGAEDGLSTGASGDLQSATRTAQSMVCRYGMDDALGLAVIDEQAMGEMYAAVRVRINEILSEQMRLAVDAIRENQKAIDAIVSVLLEKNHLKQKEIDEIFRKNIGKKQSKG